MSHEGVLRLLMPIRLAGVADGDLALEGALLDAALASAERLPAEFLPGTSVLLLDRWEARLAITPPPGASLADRQAAAAAKYAARGSIHWPYYVALAAARSHTIEIRDCQPAMAGWLRAGDELFHEPWQPFSANVGRAGGALAETQTVLRWWWVVDMTQVPATDAPGLAVLLADLRPAHMLMSFYTVVTAGALRAGDALGTYTYYRRPSI